MTSIYKDFEFGSIGYDRRDFISRPLWSRNSSSLQSIYTSSNQSNLQKLYYLDVYNINDSRSERQFTITYCDHLNSGSSSGSLENGQYVGALETKAMYSQFKQLLLEPEQNLFEFVSQFNGRNNSNELVSPYTETSEYVYVLSVNRHRYKEKLAPGSWELTLHSVGESVDAPTEGSTVIKLIDETLSQVYLLDTTLIRTGPGGQYYYVYSGSLDNGLYSGPNSATPYGIVYPDCGIIVLNGKALDASGSLNTRRTPAETTSSYNSIRLFNSISSSMEIASSNAFEGRTLESIHSSIYFARIGNGEFNYSNNISYYTSSVLDSYRIKDNLRLSGTASDTNRNVTYVTTIGLYNDDNDLLAVAKLSKPVIKTSNSEMIIKIKLDY
jgi:hypothetical protein